MFCYLRFFNLPVFVLKRLLIWKWSFSLVSYWNSEIMLQQWLVSVWHILSGILYYFTFKWGSFLWKSSSMYKVQYWVLRASKYYFSPAFSDMSCQILATSYPSPHIILTQPERGRESRHFESLQNVWSRCSDTWKWKIWHVFPLFIVYTYCDTMHCLFFMNIPSLISHSLGSTSPY